jgi:hypothetical protein
VWMRPETAQGMFVDFTTIQRTSRLKVPFGIAQTGKSFRNEITPGNFVFRTREFEQMEMEFFVEPGTDEEWHQYWIDERMGWYTHLGLRARTCACASTRPTRCPTTPSAPSTSSTTSRTRRWAGPSSRGWPTAPTSTSGPTSAVSGQDLSYYDQPNDHRYHPYVIEPAAGATRATLAFLYDAYRVEEAPDADGCCSGAPCSASTRVWRPTRSPCCRCRRRRPSRPPPRRSSTSSRRGGCASTTRRSRSGVATGARTRSARRTASPSTSTPSRTGR